MGILFGFRAERISGEVLFNSADADSSIILTRSPVADPISDAVNNVRFAGTGFGGGDSLGGAILELRARSFFRFELPRRSTITAHGHLTDFGVATLTARAATWFLDRPGFVRFFLHARMRVRAFRSNGVLLFSRSSADRTLLDRVVTGDRGAASETAIAADALMEQFLTVNPPDPVNVNQPIIVRMEYRALAIASNGAEFVLDFDFAGGGLNVPMVVVDF